jgi:ACT domain-containing protein
MIKDNIEIHFKLIEQRRQQSNINIDDLCKQVGISRDTYYKAKSNKIEIGSKKFLRLLIAVGIKIKLD